MESIQIYEIERLDLTGATVIDGFPSVGLVSSIVANYLINTLSLRQIGMMDSGYFPTVSLIRNGLPMNPVRIYASDKVGTGTDADQVVVFISEFQPPPNLIKPIASAMLDWVETQKAGLLITPEGLVVDRSNGPSEGVESAVYGIGTNQATRDLIRKHGVDTFADGVVTGVAGVLLNMGRMREFPVLSLLAEARPDFPDARAAARVIEVIDRLLPNIDIDSAPLYEEAKRIEEQLKDIRKKAKRSTKPSRMARPSMYG